MIEVIDRQFNRFAVAVRGQIGWRRFALAILAGIVTALALAPFYALPLAMVGFSTLILLLDAAVGKARPRRSAFAVGWFFGFGYFIASIYWMAFSFFVQAEQFAWMAPIAVLGMPSFLALFTGGAAFVAHQFWSNGPRRILLFAVAWMIFEYARGHVLTGLPWNLPGQMLAGTAVGAQTAAWYGVYGLSLVTVLLATLPAAGMVSGKDASSAKPSKWAGLAVLGVGILFGVGALRMAILTPTTQPDVFVRVVQPNIPQREKIDSAFWARNFERQVVLSEGAIPANAQLFILWPENGAPLLDEAKTALSVLSERLPSNAILIAGAVRREEIAPGLPRTSDGMNYYNSIAMVAPTPEGHRAVAYYDKYHLVPFGEYLPLQGFLRAVGLAQLAPYAEGFASGEGPEIFGLGGPSFAPMICYEVIFPGRLYPRGQRPDWLVTVTNDAWFGDTSGPRQHLDMARLRTIESGLPMARSANTGISAVIDAKGKILERVALYQAGRIEMALPGKLPPTLYDRLGDLLFWGLMAASLAGWRYMGTRS